MMIEHPDYSDADAALSLRHEVDEALSHFKNQKEVLKRLGGRHARRGEELADNISDTRHSSASVLAKERLNSNQLFNTDSENTPSGMVRRVRGEYKRHTEPEFQKANSPKEFLNAIAKNDLDFIKNKSKDELKLYSESPLDILKRVKGHLRT